MLEARDLVYQVGGRQLLDGINLRLDSGECLAVLGPNGAGKSTLLRLLAGELPPSAGSVHLNGRALHAWSPRERAVQRAVLAQTDTLRFAFSVEQVVGLGRYPCAVQTSAREAGIIADAMQAAAVTPLAARRYTELSTGERKRTQFARVLAQIWETADRPRFLLLDEPTASLDLAHQHEVLSAARRFAGRDVGVLAVLHDANLALAYADRVLLLRQGRVHASGAAAEVLTPANMQAVFDIEVEALARPGGGPPVLATRPRAL